MPTPNEVAVLKHNDRFIPAVIALDNHRQAGKIIEWLYPVSLTLDLANFIATCEAERRGLQVILVH